MQNDPAMGNLNYKREEFDWYPTPEWVTDVALRNILLTYRIWEPACGEGHISEAVKKAYPNNFVQSTDIVDRGYKDLYKTIDFLNIPLEDIHHNNTDHPWTVITNPPYGKLTDPFIQRALDFTQPNKGRVIMLMRNEFDCAASRRKFFADHPAFHRKIVLLKRPRWFEYKPGDAGPRHNYAWYVWDWSRDFSKTPTIIYDK